MRPSVPNMGSAKSNIVQLTLAGGLQIIAGSYAGIISGYVGDGNPDFPINPIGALIPIDGTLVGYPINAIYWLNDSGAEDLVVTLVGAPADAAWSISFIDDNNTTWTIATNMPGVVYTEPGGYGSWSLTLPGPDFPSFTNGLTYPITVSVPITLQTTKSSSGAAPDVINSNNLTWNGIPSAATYQIFRQIAGGGYSLLTTLAGTSYGDSAPAADWASGEYDYYVIAKDAGGTTLATSNVSSQTWPAAGAYNWTPRLGPNYASNFLGTAFGQGKFITVDSSLNNICTSTDNGVTWATTAVSYSPQDVATDGAGTWIVVGVDGSGAAPYLSRSIDNGVTWTTIADVVPGSGLVSVKYGGGKWVVLGYQAGASNYAVSSDGGTTWIVPGLFTTDGWQVSSLNFDGTQFFAVVAISSVRYIATSTSGQLWTAIHAPPFINSGVVAYGDGTYVSANYNAYTIRAASSLAGLANASDVDTGINDSGNSILLVGYGGASPTFLAFGFDGGAAHSSDGGATWSVDTLNFDLPSLANANSVAYGDATFVAAGYDGCISTYP
jgi:hypothetical protein